MQPITGFSPFDSITVEKNDGNGTFKVIISIRTLHSYSGFEFGLDCGDRRFTSLNKSSLIDGSTL